MTTTPKNPDTIIPERAPVLGVALRYFITGVLFLSGLIAVALLEAPMLAADYLHNPAMLAVTHLFTLGFGGSVVMGAIYQITPVLLYSNLYSERWANLHLALHAAGVLSMVYGFLEFETAWVIGGGSLVLTGALLFFTNMVLTFRAVERWNWHGYLMGTAIAFYLSTLIWGVVMALNQRYGFLGEVEGAPLIAHLALGLLGWFSLMIVGVGLKLVPMFAPSRPLPARFVAATGGSLAAGVLLILAGLFTGPALRWTGALLAAASLVAYAGGIGYSFRTRRKGPLDFSVRFAVTAAAPMLTAMAGLFLAGRQGKAGLTLLFALGFIGATILGMLLRIIPFMTWLHRFRNRAVKTEKIPFLHEMFTPRYGWAAYAAWFPGTALLSLGVGLGAPGLIIGGALVCLAGLGAFAVVVWQVLRHVTRPGGTA